MVAEIMELVIKEVELWVFTSDYAGGVSERET